MASIQALATHLLPGNTNSGLAHVVALRGTTISRATAQETYYIEDGWVFREHHGKYVECLCRTEDISTNPAAGMPVFQLR